MDAQLQKKAIRKEVLQKRACLNEEDRKCAAFLLEQVICSQEVFLEADILLTFVNYGSEIDVTGIIENAFKYGKEDGFVWVSVRQTPEETLLQVRDEGDGIPAEHQEKIWNRFYQVDPSRSEELGGAGLGLALVQQIARLQPEHRLADGEIPHAVQHADQLEAGYGTGSTGDCASMRLCRPA